VFVLLLLLSIFSASATTRPGAFFKQAAKGRLDKGMNAGPVVLGADPRSGVRNLAPVIYIIRAGKIIDSSHGNLP
jgi:hypothetical protein